MSVVWRRAGLVGPAVIGLALTGCAAAGPSVTDRAETDPLPDEAWSDVALVEGGGPAPRADRQAGTPEARAPRPIDRPGEIDVLVGQRGDLRELPADQVEELDGDGFEDYEEWEYDENDNPIPPRPRRNRLHVVVDVPYESWAGEGTFVHVLALTPTFRPAAGAEVYLDRHLVGTADDNGTLVFRKRPDVADAELGGQLHVRWRNLRRTVAYEANARTGSFESSAIYAYTDRGVYQPGQDINVRAVAWTLRGEYRPLSGQDVEVLLLDPESRIVGGGVLGTDDWGVGDLALPLPAHAAEGPYTLVAQHGDERAESPLIIQRFVPPAIEIQHDLGRFLTPRADVLATEVRLRYLDGGDFHGGTLLAVVKVDSQELGRTERRVEGPGPHRLELGAAVMQRVHDAAHEDEPVEVDLTVTDEHGRSDTVRRFMRYTRNPYRATIELDRTRYAQSDPVLAMVRLVDLDDVPQRDKDVTLDVPIGRPRGWRGTEAEYDRAWEQQDRDGDDAFRRQLHARTDEGGVAHFRFVMPLLDEEIDEAMLYASLADVEDPIAEAELPFAPPLPMRSAVPDTVVDEGADIHVEVEFPLNARPLERVVHADIVDSSGSIIHSALIPVGRRSGRPFAEGTVRAPTWGSMLLTLFCVGRRGGDVGLMTDGQNIVVHPGARISVTLSGLPDRAAPGETLHGTIEVRDAEGRPHDAALGVSVVDQAVISLLDPLERPPFDRFYNPDRKVLASTGAQTLTWPWVSRTWGEDRIDIGWPETFGWHRGDPPPRAMRARRAAPTMAAGGAANDPLSGLSLGGVPAEAAASAPEASVAYARVDVDRLRIEGRVSMPPPQAPPVRLTLRTRFDETALWLPRVVTRNGRATFEAHLPDSITAQRVSVVASDRSGGIATASTEVPVRQELFVQSDLPPMLIEGDRLMVSVAVRNHGDDARRVRVALRSNDLQVSGDPRELTVAPGALAMGSFDVVGQHPGDAGYEVSVETVGETPTVRDVERRTLYVQPAGEPVIERHQGVVRGGVPFRGTVQLAQDDRYHVARLSVTFPTVVPAIQGLLGLAESGYFGPDPAASRALGATAVYRYLEKTGQLDDDRRAELRGWLGEVTTAILLAQNEDGGWGWFWDAQSVPYISIYLLTALVELHDLDLPVPPTALAAARDFLVRSLRGDGLYDVSAIAPWEGDDRGMRMQATAEAFDVLTRLPRELGVDESGQRAFLRRLADRLTPVLDRSAPDPLTLAHTVRGLYRMRDELGLSEERLVEAARRLSHIRELVHWEPGWFDAYGGTVEAAAVALEVLSGMDRPGFEAARRDAVRYMLHTQQSWGAWHNARSTAFAIRALCMAEPGVPGDHGALVVRVDGREVRRVEVSADDLHAAALALRSIELPDLGPGEHAVEVSYGGRTVPRVELEVSRWAAGGTPPRASGPLSVRRRVTVAGAGEPVRVDLIVDAPDGRPLWVEQPLGAALSPARGDLDALVERGVISGYEVAGSTLRIGAPGGHRELSLQLRSDMRGRVTLPAASVRLVGGGAAARSRPSVVDLR